MGRAAVASQSMSAAQVAIHYGMTPRYWTRMAAEGKVPGAWQPSGEKGKWLFDRATLDRWQRSKRKEVKAWPGYTKGDKRTGAVPSVKAGNIDSPSAPKIDALLRSVCNSG